MDRRTWLAGSLGLLTAEAQQAAPGAAGWRWEPSNRASLPTPRATCPTR
jgi:hypothetical protein